MKTIYRIVAIPFSVLRIVLSGVVALVLYLINHRETQTARRHVGTMAAGLVGVLIAVLALLSNYENPSDLPGSGNLLLRGTYVALAGQVAMYGLSACFSLPGWLRWRRRRSSGRRESSGSRFLNGARVAFSVLAWSCYSAALILDKLDGGHHAAVVSILFLCSPFYWFATDLYQTWRGLNQSPGIKPMAFLLEGLVGVGVAVLLVTGAGIMVYSEGAAITGPVLLAVVAGIFQALKVLPQKMMSQIGVSDSAALAGFAVGSLTINLTGMVVLASMGVSVDLIPIALILAIYAIVGSTRQRLEQFSFSTPRKTAQIALMMLTAPLAQYWLTGALLGEWGSPFKILGGLLMLVASLSFVALDELLLLTN